MFDSLGELKFVFIFLFFFLLPVSAFAHGNVLYNVSLDFDETFRQDIVSAAQDFLNMTNDPFKFNFDHELVDVFFNPENEENEISAEVHPVTLAVHGVRDESLFNYGEEPVLSEEETYKVAERVFEGIPEEYASQLKYGKFRKEYTGKHVHTWFRYVNGVLVLEDVFEVEVDPVDGDVVAWKLSPFFYQDDLLPKNPAFDGGVAEQIALISLKAKPADFKPMLVYYKDKLVWLTRVEQLYKVYVGVNALTGELIWSGPIRGELPDNYAGPDVEVMENEFLRGLK